MKSITTTSTVIALLTLSMVIGVTSVRAAPETSQAGTTLLTPLLSSIVHSVNTVGDDSFSTMDLSTTDPPATQHYGPYASGSTDSGTCGPDWAQDTFDRHFSVYFGSGSIVVVEQFKDGSFVTPAVDSPTPNPSPGGCQTSPIPAGFVANGVVGQLHGYFIIPLPAGATQTSTDSSCVAGSPSTPCTTSGFINSHFTPACYPVTCSASTFFDHYTAPKTSTAPNSGLIGNEWKNASTDRGGNSGDIRSCNAPSTC